VSAEHEIVCPTITTIAADDLSCRQQLIARDAHLRIQPRFTGFVALALVLVYLVADGGGGAAVARSAVAASSRCDATLVHYKPYAGIQAGLAPYPWIASSPSSAGLVGHLFYYTAVKAWMRARAPGLQIYSGGQTPNGRASMKILWELLDGKQALMLNLRGKRLDGSGSFAQSFSPAGPTPTGPTQFPSIIDVPKPGCWRLTLTAGKAVTRVTVLAVLCPPPDQLDPRRTQRRSADSRSYKRSARFAKLLHGPQRIFEARLTASRGFSRSATSSPGPWRSGMSG
jgi:hypothetical protein